MEKTMELKMLLESSLKRIFQATVTDILVSVEQTLSEYQGTIQTIQTENEGLKRLLSAQRSAESLHEDGSKEDAPEQFSGSVWNNHHVTSTHTMCKVSKCSCEKTCFRKKNERKQMESASSPPCSLQADKVEEQLCVDKSSGISVPVKTEPSFEESGAGDLCQPPLNQTVKLVKNESSEVTCDAVTDVHQRRSSRPKRKCRGSEHSVKVAVVSKGYTQEGHFIKIEEQEEAEALPGNEGDHFSQQEVKNQVGQNYSTVVAEENTQEQGSNSLRCPTCSKTFSQASSLNAHIRSHSTSKAQICKMCGKSFRWASQLMYHEYTHTGEKPYACNICSKTYAHPGNLRMHRRIHTGERPYVCLYCGKRFYKNNSLKSHLRTHTG
ncbi:zinc finger protein 397 isoform X2 [Fundulus heteroclitus]|uniref:zinc finger protein 397 isoform X2 n=1 Tax=Fundulus heteroclitus TaxID=8078 RepID=UPI00165C70AD|nr:zinc finger protein 397 isoform X2 [Fundulus heteroclitus]